MEILTAIGVGFIVGFILSRIISLHRIKKLESAIRKLTDTENDPLPLMGSYKEAARLINQNN